jgi:hypothetical protein
VLPKVPVRIEPDGRSSSPATAAGIAALHAPTASYFGWAISERLPPSCFLGTLLARRQRGQALLGRYDFPQRAWPLWR